MADCKKIPFDHRNKYTGTWNFDYTIESCSYSDHPPCTNSSGAYKGKIYYNRKEDVKNSIEIEFAPGYKTVLDVDGKGNFSGCGITGKFNSKKNISFIYEGSSACTYALGSSIAYTVSGTKN